ncbi:PAP2-domain-containing protein [Sporormia fimetaria CBS 119925]|uniref:PAP2-domain-containing protein n=1 Tax=Sporormia fimetaria CBS 119925 TaxID=1340428 RepID=A0A6A6V0P7_9PLEO|nr:PAP2-domain-containing protein [Sporormia fimetaria CBS 119925]
MARLFSRFQFPDRPTFFEWFRRSGEHVLLSLVLAGIALLLNLYVGPLRTVYFTLDEASYSYPLKREVFNTTWSAVVSFAVPFATIGLLSLFFIGSFWDSNSAVSPLLTRCLSTYSTTSSTTANSIQLLGLGYALSITAFLQIWIKLLVGGPRPHFYAVCEPRDSFLGGPLYDSRICGNRDTARVNQALMSFVSGHSAAAFAGFGYLFLWINAKFKVCANVETRAWTILLLLFPVVFAIVLSGLKIVEYWHHGRDVIGGAIIGFGVACLVYKMWFRGLLDWRVNHIPNWYPSEDAMDLEGAGWGGETGLTAINFGGWKNRWSKDAEEEKEGQASPEVVVHSAWADGAVGENWKRSWKPLPMIK